MKHGILCGTRPWTASGGLGELSHDTLDDRHESGSQSGARWAVSVGRVVSALLVSSLHFARRRGYSPEDAQDLTQGFFLHVVKHRAFTGVEQLKGKFRSFLLASFQNHLSDAADRGRRLKRGGCNGQNY
jgi:hypothetical protein